MASTGIFYVLVWFMVAKSFTTATMCYDCNSLNRIWASEYCQNTRNDCGDCVDGYTTGKNGKACVAKDEILLNGKKSDVVPEGSDVILPCHFERLVDCVWKHSDSIVNISRRYNYLNANGENTMDCSIRIKHFKNTDVGLWSCEGFANSKHGVLHSTTVWLTLRKPQHLIVNADNSALAPQGQSLVLLCHFSTRVYCAWRRRGRYVDIMGRYSFVDARGNDKMVQDCSIIINQFQDIDVGQWDCESQTVAESEGVRQVSMNLRIMTTGHLPTSAGLALTTTSGMLFLSVTIVHYYRWSWSSS